MFIGAFFQEKAPSHRLVRTFCYGEGESKDLESQKLDKNGASGK